MPLQFRTRDRECRGMRRGRGRGGFTLLELVLAAALMAVLFVGMQSAVMIASKAIPAASAAVDFTAQGAALDRLALDLSYAKTISRTAPGAIAITVSDRDGDAADDTIAYSWSGTSGDPFQRQFNSGTPEDILAGVVAISLNVPTEVVTGARSYVEGGETLLATYNTSTSTSRYAIDTSSWACQSIPLSLAANIVDYRTTRVRLLLQASGNSSGTSAIELRSLRGSAPTSRVLATGSLDESSLPGGSNWISIPIGSVRYLDPNEPVGVVVRPTASPPSVEVTYRTAGAAASAGVMCTSADSGGTWTAGSGKAVLYELWGVCRTDGGATTLTRATSLQISVRCGSNAAFELNLPLANRPQVVP